MKVLLVNPSWHSLVSREGSIYNRVWFPLCLANCVALLENDGHEVKILDANAERLPPSKVVEEAKGYDKVFLTSSPIDRWQCPYLNLAPFLDIVKELGRVTDNLFIMGTHGTVRPKEVLEITGVRAIIRGEPELTVKEICSKEDLAEIRGLTYKRDGRIISNEPQVPLDLNLLPPPALHHLPIERYFYEVLGENFVLLEGSRGCPYSCIFCLKAMYGPGYRRKRPERLIQEVDYAINRFGVKTAYFMDLEFTLNRELVEKLCAHLIYKDYDFKWCCQTRADTVERGLLERMKEAKCKLIHYGVETGSARMLKVINKKASLEELEEGIRLTQRVGIETACFFMFGLPTETKEDMERTIEFAKRLNPTYASFHIASPYPGTEFYTMVKDELNNDVDPLFPEAYTGRYSLEDLKRINHYAFAKFYLKPSYILSRLRRGELKSLLQQVKLFLGYLK